MLEKYIITTCFCFFVSIANCQTLDTVVLNNIIRLSTQKKSDALLIIQDGRVVVNKLTTRSEEPIYIASAGKSLTALAVLKLLDLKLIDSLEQPVYTLFPEWKQGMKKDITIRMLLNHTSGLQNNPNASVELEPPPTFKVKNIIQLALAAELSTKPGTESAYNNKAVALLGGVVKAASGLRFDSFMVRYFYKPMNITDYDWIKDEAGNPTTHGAFILKPSDFAKFGELILQKGRYKDQQVLKPSILNLCLEQGFSKEPLWGLLWWRLPKKQLRIIDQEIVDEWKEHKIPDSTINKVRSMIGKVYTSRDSFFLDLAKFTNNNWQELFKNTPRFSKRIFNDIIGYYADGYRGNYLVVIPSLKLIAVRCAKYRDDYKYGEDDFVDFPTQVGSLIKL